MDAEDEQEVRRRYASLDKIYHFSSSSRSFASSSAPLVVPFVPAAAAAAAENRVAGEEGASIVISDDEVASDCDDDVEFVDGEGSFIVGDDHGYLNEDDESDEADRESEEVGGGDEIGEDEAEEGSESEEEFQDGEQEEGDGISLGSADSSVSSEEEEEEKERRERGDKKAPRPAAGPTKTKISSRPAEDVGDESRQRKIFRTRRDEVTAKWFADLNQSVFGGKLEAVAVVWSTRLRSTAGMFKGKSKLIVLSTKVLDTESRMRETLAHEMCHAAVGLIDQQLDAPPHGSLFKSWGRRVTQKWPIIGPVTTCHSYKIEYKYQYQCQSCKHCFGRHSKSIDCDKKCCGKCRGRLILLQASAASKRPPTAFSLFVKEHFKEVKDGMAGGTSHGDVMKELSLQFKATKIEN
jgi:predicted SprT family Zn-dependent metalloprotease